MINFYRFITCFSLLAYLPAATYSINDEELLKKREGIYPIVIPFINYNTDFGVGFFLGGFLFDNRYRTNQDGSQNRDFSKYPYFIRVGAQFFLTTLNQHRHIINLDMPKFFSDRLHFNSEIAFIRVLDNNYFGIGPSSIFDQKKIKQKDTAAKMTYSAYYKYTHTQLRWETKLNTHLYGNLYLLSGLGIGYVFVESRKGMSLDDGFTVNETLFDRDQPIGGNGGWDNYLKLGLALDGRDFIPYPAKGYLFETQIQYYPPAINAFTFSRFTAKAQNYWEIFKHFIWANRAEYNTIIGNAAFYNLAKLGGHFNLRGFVDSRFLDQSSIVFNHEIRWRFADFKIKKNRYYLTLVPFFDHGQVLNRINDISKTSWKYGYGAELLLTFNLSTIVNFTFGGSEEGFSFALDTRLLF